MTIFWSFTRQAFNETAIYRFNFWFQLVPLSLMVYGIYWVWRTLYTQTSATFGVDLHQMVTYGVLGVVLFIVLNPGWGPQLYIAQQIRSGAIDTDLVKPVDFQLNMLARDTGQTLLRLVTLTLPAFLIGYLFLDLQLPSFTHLLLFILSLVLSYVVLFSLNFMLGVLSFVTLTIENLNWAYNSLIGFFAGQLVPLWLLPNFVQSIANILPFKSIYFIPISIFIGKLGLKPAIDALLFQLCWAIVLFIISRFVWLKIYSKLVSQGG